MDRERTTKIDISEIRQLAERFTAEDLELCINQQLQTGDNLCIKGSHTEQVINELAKANFVRTMVEQGMPIREAVRELARRIRAFQQRSEQ